MLTTINNAVKASFSENLASMGAAEIRAGEYIVAPAEPLEKPEGKIAAEEIDNHECDGFVDRIRGESLIQDALKQRVSNRTEIQNEEIRSCKHDPAKEVRGDWCRGKGGEDPLNQASGENKVPVTEPTFLRNETGECSDNHHDRNEKQHHWISERSGERVGKRSCSDCRPGTAQDGNEDSSNGVKVEGDLEGGSQLTHRQVECDAESHERKARSFEFEIKLPAK